MYTSGKTFAEKRITSDDDKRILGQLLGVRDTHREGGCCLIKRFHPFLPLPLVLQDEEKQNIIVSERFTVLADRPPLTVCC